MWEMRHRASYLDGEVYIELNGNRNRRYCFAAVRTIISGPGFIRVIFYGVLGFRQ